MCSELSEVTENAFRAWALLRHHERGTRAATFHGLRSISVLLTPNLDGARDWDTTMLAITDDPGLTDDEISS